MYHKTIRLISVILSLGILFGISGFASAEVAPPYAPGSFATLPEMAGRYVHGRSYLGPSNVLDTYHAFPDEVSYYEDDTGNLCIVSSDCDNMMLSIYTYNPKTFAFISRKDVSFAGFPLWGGFYQAPDSNFYVAVGQRNNEEDDNKVVIEIRRYNAAWTLTGTASIRGGDVTALTYRGISWPFKGGLCRMMLVGGKLVVHTAREMYTHTDGLRHQMSMTFEVDTATMTARDLRSYGYYQYDLTCSHSFNQMIGQNGDDLLLIDQGDAAPRGLQLGVIKNYAAGTAGGATRKTIFKFAGDTGNNATGTTVTGFEAGKNGILVTGNSMPHYNAINGVSGLDPHYSFNIYLIVVDKNTYEPTFKWITTFAPDSKELKADEPRLIRISNDRFVLLFNVITGNTSHMEYRLVDSSGNVLAEKSFDNTVFMPGTAPIIINNRLHWVSMDQNRNWSAYTIDIQNINAPQVITVPVSSIQMETQSLTMKPQEWAVLRYTISPSNASNKDVTWKSSNESVATVYVSDEVIVRAEGYGQATITATTKDGLKTDSCVVNIPKTPVQGVVLNANSLTLEVGRSFPMSAQITPFNATNKNVFWVSSNPSVASISADGEVTALKVGAATITVTTEDGGFIKQCPVTVKEVSKPDTTVHVTGITMQTALTIDKGKTTVLTPVIAPADATNRFIFWSSSNNSVATVSQSGEVKGVKAGTATISAVTDDGLKTAVCTVTVIDPPPAIPSIITSAVYTISGGDISKITAGTTVSQLLLDLNERVYIKVFKGSQEVTGSTRFCTGMTVRLMDGNTVKQSLTAAVKGDLTGDGMTSALGLLKLKRHILGIEPLAGVFKLAGDVNEDGQTNALDLLIIKRDILGIEKIK